MNGIKKLWDGFDWVLAVLFVAAIGFWLGTALDDGKTARLEADLSIPPENYFGDTVHYDCIWASPEKNAVEKYPGYRAIKVDRMKEGFWVTLVWNGKQWPPDTLKHKPEKR